MAAEKDDAADFQAGRRTVMKHFFIYSFIVLFIIASAVSFLLKTGVLLDEISVGPVSLSTISLKWKKKLELEIKTLSFEISGEKKEQKLFDLDLLDNIVPMVLWIERIFSRIVIQEIRSPAANVSFFYEAGQYRLNVDSSLGSLQADVVLKNTILTADLELLTNKDYATRATGQMHFDTEVRLGSGTLNVNFAESLPIILDLRFNTEELFFSGKESEVITGIKPFVDLFGLSHNIQRWITDYLTGDRYTLKSFSGYFPWNDPLVLMDSFLAEVRVDGCEYTFAPGLEPIKTDFTEVLFKKGVLIITPNQGSFYGQDTEKSWLDIDFNDPENILLTARIVSHAQANRDIVNLVEYYGIPFPFLQTEGETAADLTIAVNLNKELVTAKGVFDIVGGRIAYDGKEFAVKEAKIVLENSRVNFERVQVSFQDMLQVDIQGGFDAAAGSGDYDVVIQDCSISFGDNKLTLDDSAPKPRFHYGVTPAGSIVTAESSAWKVGVLSVSLGAFSTPLSLEALSGRISGTRVSVPPYASAEVSGTFSLKEKLLDLDVTLLQYKVKDLELMQPFLRLDFQYDKELTICSEEESRWELSTVPIILYPAEFQVSNTLFAVTDGKIRYGKFFESSISGSFDVVTKMGEFFFKELDVQEESIGHFLHPIEELKVAVDARGRNLLLEVADLGLSITGGEDNSWVILFDDLSLVSEHSPILQKYRLDDGHLEVMSNGTGGYSFSAEISYEYALLIQGAKPVNTFIVNGEYGNGGLRAIVNRDIEIVYTDELKVRFNAISFNFPAIREFSEYLSGLPEESNPVLDFSGVLDASNASIVFNPDRKILADTIHLQFVGRKISMQIGHGQGRLTLSIDGKNFVLTGQGLNDDFMDGMFPGARFRSGNLSFAAKGRFGDFTAMFKIEDTLLRDFNGLNNILALVNTIPALVTFSLPSYSTAGFPVDTIAAGFEVKDGLATFSSLVLESPEISMAGKGWVDFIGKKIGMDLNLITRAKQNVNKIPLVGYILVGKEKRPSITVKVTGDLFDPEVEYSAFKEVVTEPFYMLYRTLALPAHLVAPMLEKGRSFGEDVEWKAEDELAR